MRAVSIVVRMSSTPGVLHLSHQPERDNPRRHHAVDMPSAGYTIVTRYPIHNRIVQFSTRWSAGRSRAMIYMTKPHAKRRVPVEPDQSATNVNDTAGSGVSTAVLYKSCARSYSKTVTTQLCRLETK
jgi:hypothetical protein